MFVELPNKFDYNEVFIFSSLLLVCTVAVFLPKRFSLSQVICILIFNFFLGVVVDQILAVPPYDYYDIMDSPKMDIMDLILYSLLYPITTYIFFHLLDIIKNKNIVPIFILLWSVFVLGLEWVASKLGVYKYNKWSFIFSLISYLIIFSINALVLYYIKNTKTTITNVRN